MRLLVGHQQRRLVHMFERVIRGLCFVDGEYRMWMGVGEKMGGGDCLSGG